MFNWFYGVRRDWNKQSFSHIRGPVLAAHVKDRIAGSHRRTHDVRLSSGVSGTVTTDEATVISRQEFWLKTPQGEKHLWIDDEYIPVSAGDQVTAIWYDKTWIAYINHATRRETIIEHGLKQAAYRPVFGRHLLFCFVLVPILLLPLMLPISSAAQGHPLVPLTKPLLKSLGAIIGLAVVADAFWFLLGFPALLYFYRNRRAALVDRTSQKIRSLAGFDRRD